MLRSGLPAALHSHYLLSALKRCPVKVTKSKLSDYLATYNQNWKAFLAEVEQDLAEDLDLLDQKLPVYDDPTPASMNSFTPTVPEATERVWRDVCTSLEDQLNTENAKDDSVTHTTPSSSDTKKAAAGGSQLEDWVEESTALSDSAKIDADNEEKYLLEQIADDQVFDNMMAAYESRHERRLLEKERDILIQKSKITKRRIFECQWLARVGSQAKACKAEKAKQRPLPRDERLQKIRRWRARRE